MDIPNEQRGGVQRCRNALSASFVFRAFMANQPGHDHVGPPNRRRMLTNRQVVTRPCVIIVQHGDIPVIGILTEAAAELV